MATPDELDALSASLRGAYESAWADIAAEQARIAEDPAKFARRARLKELQAAVDDRLDLVDEAAASWLADEFPVAYRLGAETAGSVLDQPFRWTTHDNEAITLMAQDTFDELLAATDGVSDSTKRLIRRLAKEQALLKAAAGKTATQAARQLRRLLEAEGIFAVKYRDGSRHGLADYTDMLLRTKTGVAHNAGLLNFGRRSGTLYYEVFDGADCGWISHDDNDKANRTIRHADDCAKATLSHPRCRRSFGPRPDITSPEQAKAAKSSVTDAQAADQAAAERARAQAQRTRANTRRRQDSARARRAAERQAAAARRPAARRAPQKPPDPIYPGNLSQKDAEAWMRNRWGVDVEGKKRAILLDGLGDTGANAMAGTMDRLMRQYPRTAERVRVFGASSPVTKAINQSTQYRARNISPRAYADAMREVGSIRLSGAKAKKFDETTKMLENDVATGFHPPGTANLESVVAHEFGHHLRWEADARVGSPEVSRQIGEVIGRHSGFPDGPQNAAAAKARYDAMRSVSRYAASDYDELAGEALAEVTMSPSPRPLAVDIVNVLVRLAEGVS